MALAPFDHVQQRVKGLLAKMLFQSAAFQTTYKGLDLDIFTTVDLPVLLRSGIASGRPIVHRGLRLRRGHKKSGDFGGGTETGGGQPAEE